MVLVVYQSGVCGKRYLTSFPLLLFPSPLITFLLPSLLPSISLPSLSSSLPPLPPSFSPSPLSPSHLSPLPSCSQVYGGCSRPRETGRCQEWAAQSPGQTTALWNTSKKLCSHHGYVGPTIPPVLVVRHATKWQPTLTSSPPLWFQIPKQEFCL